MSYDRPGEVLWARHICPPVVRLVGPWSASPCLMALVRRSRLITSVLYQSRAAGTSISCTKRLSRCATVYHASASEFSALGTAKILVNGSIPEWGRPKSLLAGNERQFYLELSRALCVKMGIENVFTSAYHVMSNEGTNHVHRSIDEMLSLVVNEGWDDRDKHLPQLRLRMRTQSIGPAANNFHLGRVPHLPPYCNYERRGACGHPCLEHDQLECSDSAREGRRLMY